MLRRIMIAILGTVIFFQACTGCFCTVGRRHGPFPTVPFNITTNVPGDWHSHIIQAEATWTAVTLGAFRFQNGPLTTNSGWNLDGQNVIGYDDLTFVGVAGLLAGVLTVDTTFFGCQITEVDMMFNNNLPGVGIPGGVWDTSGTPSMNHFDVQSVALHELGHTLELMHVDCPSDSIMVPSYATMSNNFTRVKRDLHGCDIAAADIIYIFQWPVCLPLFGFCAFSPISASGESKYLYMNEEYSKLVKTHGEEVKAILEGDDDLMQDILALSMANKSLLEAWVNGDPSFQQQRLSAQNVSEIDGLLARLQSHASSELKSEIINQRQILYSLQDHLLDEAFSKVISIRSISR